MRVFTLSTMWLQFCPLNLSHCHYGHNVKFGDGLKTGMCEQGFNGETAKSQLHMFSISRALEADRKSLQSLSVQSNTSKHSSICGHSRQGSISSVMSNQSASSNISNMQYDETGE